MNATARGGCRGWLTRYPGSDDAWALRCFPAAFTDDVDAVLALFERQIERVDLNSHHDVWVSIKDVVIALNSVSERWKLIETGEREELCQYIEDVLRRRVLISTPLPHGPG